MIAASNASQDIVKLYLDEAIYTIPQNQNSVNFEQTKLIIYKVAEEIKIIKEMIIDKETDLFIAARFPSLGLIIETSRKNGLAIKPIFKGKFFTVGTEQEQIEKMQYIVLRIAQLSNSFPVLTKIDIATDIANMKAEEWDYKKFQFGFRARIYGHIETQRPDEISTWYITNRNFQVCIYNKKKENQSQKNQEKKDYYNELYKDYEDITRIEIRIKSEHTKKYTQALLETDSIEKLARKIISDFTDKRRIYNRSKTGKLVSKKNQAKLLTEWETWKKLRATEEIKIPLNKDLKIKHQYSSLKNVKKSIIDTAFKNQATMSKKELLDFIENNFDEIESKTKERLQAKLEHEKEVKLLKEKIKSLEARQVD